MSEENSFLLEKPPSPVLSNNKITRKFLQGRRMQKKSRVKLTNRFQENILDNLKANETCSSIADATATFTQSQAENMPEIDGLFQKIKETNVSIGSEMQINNDFQFKKPISPAVCTKKVNELQPPNVNHCSGFKTAGGKNIKFTDDVMKQSRKLFDDILYPECNRSENTRQNKYAFLSKRKSDLNSSFMKNNFSCVEEKSSEVGIQSLIDELHCKDRNTGFFENKCIVDESRSFIKPPFGFTTASGKSVPITEVAYNNACKKFVGLSESKLAVKTENCDEEKDTDDILSTEETNQLFCDFTVLEDKLTEKEKIKDTGCSKGFAARCIQNSIKNAAGCKMLSSNDLLTKNQKAVNFTANKSPSATSLGGFSTASGTKIHINEFLLNTAKNKFGEELDFRNELSIKEEFTDLNAPELFDELLSDFPVEKDKCTTKTKDICHEQFKGFLEESIEKSKKNVDVFMTFFGKYCDNEETLLPNCCGTSLPPELHDKTLKPVVSKSGGFTTAAGNRITVSKAALNRAQEIFNKTDETKSEHLKKISNRSSGKNIEMNMGFKTAAGNSVNLSESAINRAKQMFQNVNSELLECQTLPSTLESKSVQNLPNDNFKSLMPKSGGFSTASGNRVSVSERALIKAQSIFKNTDDVNSDDIYLKRQISNERVTSSTTFQTIAGNSISLPESALSKDKQSFQSTYTDLSLNNFSCGNASVSEESISFGQDSNSSTKSNINKNSNIRKKKSLGISSCKQIQIPKHKIEQAMKLFEDEKSAVMSPIRTSAPHIYNSTPLKNDPIVHIDSDITPIKNTDKTVVLNPNFDCLEIANDRFSIRDCTKGTIDSWDAILENEKRNLELKMKILTEKQEYLRVQKHFLEHNRFDLRRRHSGVLFTKKQSSERISLQKFLEIDSAFRKRFDITPDNAQFVHFNYANQNLSKIQTLDGACVIPNVNDFVGLSEIEPAFKVMDGVDPKLIPNGWIRNHFKWIVWKLASYENFAKNMKDCLNLENVMQQLKYRYDREIDRAERSTLRKIFEMDDAPQKRMVLCVANIFNVQDDSFELELTDGWYSIRTVIDVPLCKQVARKKIQIGTKLMIYGAELLNCEGCHPLEATDLVRLKIHCNSTRRTRWYVKLGYQRCPQPFPLKLHSLFSKGGLIGCIKIFVARVYPVKYTEKQNKLTVWRNRRAEEVRAQEWENKGRQDMEKLRETITRDYEKSLINKRQNISANVSSDEIKKINCPETLFTLYQNSKDPERLQEMLSNSQTKSIMEYQQRLSFKQQQEISRKIEDRVSKLQIPKRDVSSVLQLLVLDVHHPTEKAYVFQIWRPLEVHFETIKESSVFCVYNVMPTKNGGLSAMNRTRFQLSSEENSKFNKYKRTLLTISNLTETTKPLFNEFDTVGVVVTMTVDSCTQSVWLADSFQKLLYIKIFEGPKTCLLLDKLKVGQIVAGSNLVFSKSKFEFGEAIANHLSVLSCYPLQKHLQEGMNALNEQLPKDLKIFLEQCNKKILYYIDKVDITEKYQRASSRSLVQSNSLFGSEIFDESSDVLYSMIDVDNFS